MKHRFVSERWNRASGMGQSWSQPDGLLPPYIEQSVERCRELGLSPDDKPDFSGPARNELKLMLEENQFLCQHAAPVMETLYQQIANTHSMVLLTSASGRVLHTLGDPDFLDKARKVALTVGMDWSERSKGTNAIGTALTEGEALTVHGEQHFLRVNQFLTCSCAPIYDPHGALIGALDVTGDQRSYQHHTLALVRMSAQMIENHMYADTFPKAIRLHFHSRSEFLGTLAEGIAVFTPEGGFLSANRSAQFQLGLSFRALQAHTFSSLFGIPVSSLLESAGHAIHAPIQLCLHNGVKVWCRLRFKRAPWSASSQPSTSAAAYEEPQSASISGGRAKAAPVKVARSMLENLDTGDPQLSAIIQKLRLVSTRNIPIMILGETGTGKELLAQAIHGDSPRHAGPFVSVNCASIPDTLIESELFGYEEGAFTGARKKGAIGRIRQAHGGTLFLDEIGDMPKHLQARLLRVLQERKVTPLGTVKEYEVDIAIISATHKNPKTLINEGQFREDLYYRLNGLVVRLPALRERTDLTAIVNKILGSLSAGPVEVSEEVMSLFKRHTWPGNIRQLYNILHTAVAMLAEDQVIRVEHLSEDFLEDVKSSASPRAARESLGGLGALDRCPSEPAMTCPPVRLQEAELAAIAEALRNHRGNISAAAKALGVSRNTIYRKKHLLPSEGVH